MPKQYTRKVVHILVGFEWIFLYHFIGSGVHFLAVCAIFLLLLIIAYKGKLMPMISSDEDNAPGTVYYAVAMTAVAAVGCLIPDVMLPFGVGIFCTSIGDGAAGLIGQLVTKNNPRIYGKKTLFGAVANFICSFFSAFIMSLVFDMGLEMWHCLAIATLSTSLELIVGYGLDNIAVTWAVTALAYAFMYVPVITHYIVPIILTPIIVIFALKKRALTLSGVLAALAIDLVISASLGNAGFILLLLFFVGGMLSDKVKYKRKNRSTVEELKSGARDHMQVLVNGLIPALAAFLYMVSENYVFVIAFIAALSEALADTVASGIGALSKNTFDLFRWESCEGGLSGGMSVLGTASSLAGAALIPAVALLMGACEVWGMLIAICAAFCGAIFDSFLGSVFQVKYRCTICDKITEKHDHCGERTSYLSGLTLIDNDVVNLFSTLFAAGLSITLTTIFI